MTFLISILGIDKVQQPIFNVYGSVLVNDFKYISLKYKFIVLEPTSWSICFLYSLHQVPRTDIVQLAVQKCNKAGITVPHMLSSVNVA